MTGYPFTPEGLAHLDLAGAGRRAVFASTAACTSRKARTSEPASSPPAFRLDARLHADPEALLVNSIAVRLRQGGQIDGDLSLVHWLPKLSGEAALQAAAESNGKLHAPTINAAPTADEITIPVNGKVTSTFKDVALDTILEMVCDPPFQHLGLDARVSGPANALWINGDKNTLSVQALLNLTPPAQAAPGKVLTSGLIDATYTQRDGAVDMRKLELNLPSSQLTAHGHLGAYPLNSPSAFAVDFHTGNLGEFDTVLRDLGVERNGKAGTAALPVALNGRLDLVNGFWTGSLVDPRIAGDMKATQVAVEMAPALPAKIPVIIQSFIWILSKPPAVTPPPALTSPVDCSAKTAPRSASAEASAAAAAPIVHGGAPVPSYDANSVLQLRLLASKVDLADAESFHRSKAAHDRAL